jgi:hypothetical protein
MRLITFLFLLVTVVVVRAQEYDILVYGATPGGIAAALAGARDGERVLLVEPSRRIGGMMTNGLSHTDIRTMEGMNGAFLDFARRVEADYRETYGADSPQVKACFHGTQFEPKVALSIFEKMIAEQPLITVRKEWVLDAVKSSSNADGEAAATSRALEIALLYDAEGNYHSTAAYYFIDATYEGDLMAAARIPYRVGREAGGEYGESLAPEEADDQLEAYNFRLCMTRDPGNRVSVKEPPGYLRRDYVDMLALLLNGPIDGVFGTKATHLFRCQGPLPDGKFDINDMAGGPVRLSLPGENDTWPEGESGLAARRVHDGAVAPYSRTGLRQSRERVFEDHLRWDVGLIYFLQNDDAVPAKFRNEAREWGWCKDEFTESSHLPMELDVREARRAIGQYVFTQKDTAGAADDARAVLHTDAIAVGDYGLNCHGTAHEGPRFGGRHTGEFYEAVAPYQIPFGVLVAKGYENVLVPVAASASHVGFCALRSEPIWMSLGEAAGHAAHLARRKHGMLQTVPLAKLQDLLHADGAATIYVSDVPPGSPDFAAVQWWGTAGGLHGLAPAPDPAGRRGKNICSEYCEAFPGHAAELEKPLDAGLAERWEKLAVSLGVDAGNLPKADGKTTRGVWLRAAWAARRG